ncbi:TIGR02611 family protein [Kineococcus sp. SYSU DK003]|uniref:TIGR02611 family protein n=1 Tax=Kineococcus sp. SYSU DK003 TaxID=3383124 RepID=UPI003D7C6999
MQEAHDQAGDPREDLTGATLGRRPLPDPPQAAEPVARGVGEDELTAHQHRLHRARAALHARREAIRADAHRNRVYRAVVGAVGTFVVALGLLLVPLPGPGWLVVFLGLALLGTEFSSAQRLKVFGERQVHRWARWIARRSLATRAALGTGTAAAGAAVVWGYLAWQGLPGWTPEVVTAQLQWIPGLER